MHTPTMPAGLAYAGRREGRRRERGRGRGRWGRKEMKGGIVEGDAGNTPQGFAVGLTVAELQLRLPDVYKEEERGRTASRLRLPQHAGGFSRLDIPSSLAGPYTSLYSYGVPPTPVPVFAHKAGREKGRG